MRAIVFIVLSIAIWGSGSSYTCAQFLKQVDSTRQSNIFLYQNNVGVTGYDAATKKFGVVWPRSSNHCFVFASGLWVGAVVENQGELDTLVFMSYNLNSGWSWATPTSYVFRETLSDIERFRTTFTDEDLTNYEGNAQRRREQGFPLGLRFEQELVAWLDGGYDNSFVVNTTLTNTNADRVLYDLVMGCVVDVFIGTMDSLSQISRDDKMNLLQGGRVPIIQVHDSLQPQLGVLGISFVKSPGAGITTSSFWPITIDFEAPNRYEFLTTSVLDTDVNDYDISLVLGHEPIDLDPGESIDLSVLFMFADSISQSTDQKMIDLVNNWKTTNSVGQGESEIDVSVYPNPIGSTNVIHIRSQQTLLRSELFNSLGVLVTSSIDDPTVINVTDLPAGSYLLRVVNETGIQSKRIVVIH